MSTVAATDCVFITANNKQCDLTASDMICGGELRYGKQLSKSLPRNATAEQLLQSIASIDIASRNSIPKTGAGAGSNVTETVDDTNRLSLENETRWLCPDTEHAHTVCPLRPFAYMIVELPQISASNQDNIYVPVSAQRLSKARVISMSGALSRRMRNITKQLDYSNKLCNLAVGDMFRFTEKHRSNEYMEQSGYAFKGGRRDHSLSTTTSGLWGVLDWLVGSNQESADEQNTITPHTNQLRCLQFRNSPALVSSDDPHFIGNEGLGVVEIATAVAAMPGNSRHGGGNMFALCAHILHPRVASTTSNSFESTDGTGLQRAVVHITDVSTLHRVSCLGLDHVVGPYYMKPPPSHAGDHLRWMAILISRHGLVEMAYPLRSTPVGNSDDNGKEGCLAVSLASLLGESIFSRLHPEDVIRVIKGLRLAWDARPTRSYGSSASRRQVHQQIGIAVSNGIVELTIQMQIYGIKGTSAGSGRTIDWDDPDSMEALACFARMQLARWPPVTYSSSRHPNSAELQDGYVMAALQPLPEPKRRRGQFGSLTSFSHGRFGNRRRVSFGGNNMAYASDSEADIKKQSISSVSTLVSPTTGVAVAGQPSSSDSSNRLCRSASSLSCQDEATVRTSIECVMTGDSSPALPPRRSHNGIAIIPTTRPIVGLSASAVATATGMSPHIAMRRRPSIPVGSLPRNDSARMFATPRETELMSPKIAATTSAVDIV